MRFGLRVFRVSGLSSAGLGLRVFRASEFRAIRMLGIAPGSSLGFSGVIAIRMLDCWILSGILSGTTWLPGDNLHGFGRVWVLLFDTCQSGSIMILEGSCGVPFSYSTKDFHAGGGRRYGLYYGRFYGGYFCRYHGRLAAIILNVRYYS